MDLNGLTLFKQMESKLQWLSARQTVLSENIANADTPRYQARDLKPFSEAMKGAMPLQRTNTSHILGGNASATPVVAKERFAVETSPDGNQISLEDQLTKVADTGMDYQMITNLYRKQVSMIKTALGRNGTTA